MGDQSIQRSFTGVHMLLGSLSAFAILLGCASGSVAAEEYAKRNQKLIEAVRAHAAVQAAGAPGGRISEAVLTAMRTVPRHEFVPKPYRHLAYRDGRCQSVTVRPFLSPTSSR